MVKKTLRLKSSLMGALQLLEEEGYCGNNNHHATKTKKDEDREFDEIVKKLRQRFADVKDIRVAHHRRLDATSRCILCGVSPYKFDEPVECGPKGMGELQTNADALFDKGEDENNKETLQKYIDLLFTIRNDMKTKDFPVALVDEYIKRLEKRLVELQTGVEPRVCEHEVV